VSGRAALNAVPAHQRELQGVPKDLTPSSEVKIAVLSRGRYSTALWESGYIGTPLPPDVVELANYGIPEWMPGPETVHLSTIRATALALEDYAWTFTDAVPGVKLTQTFNWVRPTFYAQDLIQRLLAELFKIAVAIPLINFIIHMFKDRTGRAKRAGAVVMSNVRPQSNRQFGEVSSAAPALVRVVGGLLRRVDRLASTSQMHAGPPVQGRRGLEL
jgi:hypothetical protein